MDRRSRSIESPRRYKSRREHSRRHSRSRSRSRNRSRDRRRRSRSRSRSRERYNRRSSERDLYKDIINEDYQDERDRYRPERKSRDRNNREMDRGGYGGPGPAPGYDGYRRDRDRDRHKRYYSSERDDHSDSYDSDYATYDHYYNQTPNNIIILRGLAPHITEADISSDLLQHGLQPLSIRLIRKRKTGASRGFAFVEFNSEEEATRWMEYKQGNLMLQDQYRAVMQYSHTKEPLAKERVMSDWYCAKCGVFNFKRRENCFKCYASREESEKGGEGSDEVSNILTKKIMLRNLDVLTNEEGVLTVMQEVVPTLVSKISKILICRDPLTSTSRGICYLYFDNLVDSMNTHNALKALDPPLHVECREVLISYCVDSENKQISKSMQGQSSKAQADSSPSAQYTANTYQYTLADVPRLAEYSASMYASTPAEQEHYVKYYTQYYIAEITKGQYGNLPTMSQLGESANSGAAVAMSAIQRKQNKYKNNSSEMSNHSHSSAGSAATVAPAPVQTPNGSDGKKYPTPDVSLYQYDDTSGYYYDPMTGLYYDAHSQYYYNNETSAYLYWSQEHSTYLLAASGSQPAAMTATATAPATLTTSSSQIETAKPAAEERKVPGKKEPKQDKVKVAKKIVKDMEKWAKQLNQKKDMPFAVATPSPILTTKLDDIPPKQSVMSSGYADVGFSILEKKEKGKLEMPSTSSSVMSKLVPQYGSDSDDHDESNHSQTYAQEVNEKDYVDFDKLTCLLCKRAFQSQDILNKHLKMSNLHKENLQKYNLTHGNLDGGNSNSNASYRDRAKERRQKYGESDPPPPNRSKERFEKELKSVSSSAQPNLASMPIGENNVGNRLLQKMGWSEGQGLGKSNQGRTKIIEADARNSTAGLGNKTSAFNPGDDYKSYIKRMMKSRYEQVDVKD